GRGLLDPVADRGFEQAARGEPVARIVEAEHRKPALLRKLSHHQRLGASHVREEAREPEKSEIAVSAAAAQAIGDAPALLARADLQELRFLIVHPKKHPGASRRGTKA